MTTHQWLYNGQLFNIDGFKYIAVATGGIPVGRNDGDAGWTDLMPSPPPRIGELRTINVKLNASYLKLVLEPGVTE